MNNNNNINSKSESIITVAIPFYNAEKFLSDSIRSVLNQTYRDFELLLIDDGSTDKSLMIAKEYEANDHRVIVISDGENLGLPARLNQICLLAKGIYVARMDSDDIMHPDRLLQQKMFLDNNPDYEVVGTGYYNIDTDNNILSEGLYKEFPDSIHDVLCHNCLMHPSVMGRREWFLHHPYDVNAYRIEDLNLWLRTIGKSKFANIQDYLMYYRTVGLPYYKKYISTQMGELIEVKKIKNQISYFSYIKYAIIIWVKCFIYTVFSFLHLTDLILKMRARKVVNISIAEINLKRALSK